VVEPVVGKSLQRPVEGHGEEIAALVKTFVPLAVVGDKGDRGSVRFPCQIGRVNAE
jgi:hypothetical protein